MLTDSHCHLASHRFHAEEIPSMVDAARSNGVSRIVTLATSLNDLQANLDHASHPSVHACIGIHPCDVHHAPDDAVRRLGSFAGDPKVCAIGETGLDYFHAAPDGWDETMFHERQRVFLIQHFELAASASLNLVIHTRDRSGHASFEDALEIFRHYHHQVRAVFHCFAGPWENAARVIELGGLVSFGGVVTFKNARDVRDAAIQCPQGSFMLETDSPYLAPEPIRGQRNEPAHIRPIAEHLAALRGETVEQLAAHTTQTAAAFFRFRPTGN